MTGLTSLWKRLEDLVPNRRQIILWRVLHIAGAALIVLHVAVGTLSLVSRGNTGGAFNQDFYWLAGAFCGLLGADFLILRRGQRLVSTKEPR